MRVPAPHGPRQALNEVKWKEGALVDVVVTYVHRGAPGDVASFTGADVVDLGRSFVEIKSDVGTTMLPYHRILVIRSGRDVVWARRPRT